MDGSTRPGFDPIFRGVAVPLPHPADRAVATVVFDYAHFTLLIRPDRGIVYGAITAATHPWGSARVLAPLLGGVVVLGVFVSSQAAAARRAGATPLLPLRFLSNRTRVAANTVTVFYAVFFAQFFFTTLYLQQVLGFSALRAGLAFLPFGSPSAWPSGPPPR